MNKLFFKLKNYIPILILFVGVFALCNVASAYTYSSVLQLGSGGSSVTSLQKLLGVSPVSGNYDYTTRGAVVSFQLSHSLTADGVVGPATGKALVKYQASLTPPSPPKSTQPPVSNSNNSSNNSSSNSNNNNSTSQYPAGCTSSSGYSSITGKLCTNPLLPAGCKSTTDRTEISTVTGQPCISSIVYPNGCNSLSGYSITTGLRCNIPIGCAVDSSVAYSVTTGEPCSNVVTPLVYGCSARTGYSALTGASCLTGYQSTSLRGTNGWLDTFTKGYSGISSVYANQGNATLATYALSGEKDADIRITSMTLEFKLISGSGSSYLNQYVKNINISQNGRVGTVDINNISKNGSTYTATIPLYGATVYGNQNTYFYVTSDTVENIDSSNNDNTWQVKVTQVRFMDGAGRTANTSSVGDLGDASASEFHFVSNYTY